MDGKTLEYLKKTKMKNMAEVERKAYIEMIEKLGLDLLTDEVVFFQNKPYITRDGLLHIARNFQDLESIQYITIYRGFQGNKSELFSFDFFKMIDNINNYDVTQLLPQPKAYDEVEVFAVICRVKRKNMGWFEGIAWLEDYSHKTQQKGFSVWKTSAYTMLTVRALTKALKVAYAVGMTSVEEIAEIQATKMDVETSMGSDVERMKLLTDVTEYINMHATNDDEVKQLKQRFKHLAGGSVKEATFQQLQNAFTQLKQMLEGDKNGNNKK